MTTPETRDLRQAALDDHAQAPAGKLAVTATKPLLNPRDLALAYSPGVAAPCEEIVRDPANAHRYTARGNLVAVITNGTAVLGLGASGGTRFQAGDGGKAVLFKKFAGIDLLRHRDRPEGPGQAGRSDRGAGAYLRRGQPGGHQGP